KPVQSTYIVFFISYCQLFPTFPRTVRMTPFKLKFLMTPAYMAIIDPDGMITRCQLQRGFRFFNRPMVIHVNQGSLMDTGKGLITSRQVKGVFSFFRRIDVAFDLYHTRIRWNHIQLVDRGYSLRPGSVNPWQPGCLYSVKFNFRGGMNPCVNSVEGWYKCIVIWSRCRSIRYPQLQYTLFHPLLHIRFPKSKVPGLPRVTDDIVYLKIVACRLYIVPYPYQAVHLYHLHLVTPPTTVRGSKCRISRHRTRVKIFGIHQTFCLFALCP